MIIVSGGANRSTPIITTAMNHISFRYPADYRGGYVQAQQGLAGGSQSQHADLSTRRVRLTTIPTRPASPSNNWAGRRTVTQRASRRDRPVMAPAHDWPDPYFYAMPPIGMTVRICRDETACPVMRHVQNWNICVPSLHCSTPSVSRS